MEKFLADTHAIVWRSENNPTLGDKAQQAFDLCEAGGGIIYLSVMTFLEIDYLVAKKKIDAKLPVLLLGEVKKSPDSALRILDVNLLVYDAFVRIPSRLIPEMPDRIIAATALAYSCPLITKDSKISAFDKIRTIW